MTCQELQRYFADPFDRDGEQRARHVELTQHIAVCGDCNRFLEIQRELGSGLKLLREAAPQPSDSLESAVLAKYRTRANTLKTFGGPAVTAKRRWFPVLAWSAAFAAAVLVIAIAWLPRTKTVTEGAIASEKQQAVAPELSKAESNVAEPAVRRAKTGVSRKRQRPAGLPTSAEQAAPMGFRSLMYCDELSCAGAMEMIRVQLPASAVAGVTPASLAKSGAVFADVLVGPDGIARGIRVEN
jgi:hypothetical protein